MRRRKKLLIYPLLGLLFLSCAAKKVIVEKPILFDEQRIALSLEYMRDRYHLERNTPTIIPKMIVAHWTAIGTLEESFNAFYKTILPGARADISTKASLNVSAHFLVAKDGTIYRLLPETTMARHVIGLNHCAIGIENVGGNLGNPLTDKQLESNIWLVKYLSKKYVIDYLIGHYEYTQFENHPLWLEQDAHYKTVKIDPGVVFMKQLREATAKLNFKEIPKN